LAERIALCVIYMICFPAILFIAVIAAPPVATIVVYNWAMKDREYSMITLLAITLLVEVVWLYLLSGLAS